MSQQLFFTNEATGLTSLTTVHPPTAMHLIEVGAHQRRDPRWGRQIWPFTALSLRMMSHTLTSHPVIVT